MVISVARRIKINPEGMGHSPQTSGARGPAHRKSAPNRQVTVDFFQVKISVNWWMPGRLRCLTSSMMG